MATSTILPSSKSIPLTVIGFTLFLASTICRAELPAFNPQVPTKFDGQIQGMEAGSGPFNVYLSGPANAKAALVMIHEWWGLNPHIKGLADQLGKMGYRVYAVDLYDGKTTDNADTAATYMKMDDPAKSLARLRAAMDDAAKKHGKVGTIGWCFGGGWSLKASLADPEKVNATVIYYGALVTDPERLKTLKGPVLGIFGTQDKWISPASVTEFEKGLIAAGKTYRIKSYEADHAFANPSGVKFQQDMAQDAWKLTLEFLGENLMGAVPQKPAGKGK